jgi:hypothetical protein
VRCATIRHLSRADTLDMNAAAEKTVRPRVPARFAPRWRVAGLGLLGMAFALVLAAPASSAAALVVADAPAAGAGAPIEFQMLPPGSPWNTDVSGLPVDPRSNAYISRMGADTEVHPDFGTIWNGGPNGIPYVVVRGSQPKVPVSFYYADESDPGPYPIPPDAPVEWGSDHHVLALDVDNRMLYEMWDATYQPLSNSWHAGSGAIWNLNTGAPRPAGWTSADAAGMPMLPGLVRFDEVSRGEITHALRFTVPQTRRAYIYPANHFADDSTDPDLPPMGLRVRLRADYDVSGFPPEVQVILRALKKYGMFVCDDGGPWYISGAPDMRWNDDSLHAITAVKGSDFEVVDTSGLPGASPPSPAPPRNPPSVHAGRSARAKAGVRFARNGYFTDPGGSRWTATVSYGDGRRGKLALSSAKRFRISHTYRRAGTYRVTVCVRSRDGRTGTATFAVKVRRH